jgi:hypothetical protein
MLIDLVPTVPVALSLGACGLLPVVLVALSHGPFRIAAPGRRFVLAAALAWAAWLAAMTVVAPGWVDVVAGGLLLATATLAGFTLWTLIAWGFTLSMLLALDRAGRPLSAEEWALAHTRGKPLAAFTRDRLGVLFALGLAEVRGENVVMTAGRGRRVARIAGALRLLFGLPR